MLIGGSRRSLARRREALVLDVLGVLAGAASGGTSHALKAVGERAGRRPIRRVSVAFHALFIPALDQSPVAHALEHPAGDLGREHPLPGRKGRLTRLRRFAEVQLLPGAQERQLLG